METKEEILSKRIGTYGFTKLELSKPIICPIEALDAMQEYSDQNTKPLIEKISSLEASLLDVTRKSCARVDELKDEIADLKSQLLISEQKVKLNYNCAIESSKSEANEAVESQEDLLVDLLYLRNAKKVSYNDLMSQFTITRNNK